MFYPAFVCLCFCVPVCLLGESCKTLPIWSSWKFYQICIFGQYHLIMEVIGIWILESECFFMLFVFNTDRCKVMHIGYELLTAYIMMSDGDNNSQFVRMCSRQAYENKISQKQPRTTVATSSGLKLQRIAERECILNCDIRRHFLVY